MLNPVKSIKKLPVYESSFSLKTLIATVSVEKIAARAGLEGGHYLLSTIRY